MAPDVETPTTRILASTLITATNRLFITEGENALSLPPPGQFHVSLQILNQEGVRIRQLTYIAAPEDEIAPISEKANALEAAKAHRAGVRHVAQSRGRKLPGGLFQIRRAQQDEAQRGVAWPAP